MAALGRGPLWRDAPRLVVAGSCSRWGRRRARVALEGLLKSAIIESVCMQGVGG